MADKWLCSANGQVLGPFTPSQIRDAIETGQVPPIAPTWRDECVSGPTNRAEAVAAQAFLPNWLDDVRETEELERRRSFGAGRSQVPDWMCDFVEFETPGTPRVPPAPPSIPSPPAAPSMPQWEAPKPQSPPPVLGAPASIAEPMVHAADNDARLVAAPPPATPILSPAKGKASPVPPPERTVPVNVPLAEPKLPPGGTVRPVSVVVPLPAAFSRAQSDLSNWLDEDANLDAVMTGTRETWERFPAFDEILAPLRCHGVVAVTAFWKYAHFLIENRRCYYRAVSKAQKR